MVYFNQLNTDVCFDSYYTSPLISISRVVNSITFTYLEQENKHNKQVAILCNHQKTKSKAHDHQAEGLSLKVAGTREAYDRLKEAYDKIVKLKGGKRDAAFQKEKEKYNDWDDKKQSDWINQYGTEEQIEQLRSGGKSKKSNSKKTTKKKDVESDSSVCSMSRVVPFIVFDFG